MISEMGVQFFKMGFDLGNGIQNLLIFSGFSQISS